MVCLVDILIIILPYSFVRHIFFLLVYTDHAIAQKDVLRNVIAN
jgi:hypothetical protein